MWNLIFFLISLHMEKSTFQSRGGGGGVFLLIFIDIVYSKWSSTSEKSERDIFSACPGGGGCLKQGEKIIIFHFFCLQWGPMSLGEKLFSLFCF